MCRGAHVPLDHSAAFAPARLAPRPMCPCRSEKRASAGAHVPRGKACGSKGSGMIERRTAAYECLQFAHLAGVPGLTHAIFTRRGGFSAAPYAGLNLSYTTGDDPATVRRNRAVVVAALD